MAKHPLLQRKQKIITAPVKSTLLKVKVMGITKKVDRMQFALCAASYPLPLKPPLIKKICISKEVNVFPQIRLDYSPVPIPYILMVPKVL